MKKPGFIFSFIAALFALFVGNPVTLCASGVYPPLNEKSDTVGIYFGAGKWLFDQHLKENPRLAEYLKENISSPKEFSHFYKNLRNINIVGTSSPEGRHKWNLTLSKWRGEQVGQFILSNTLLTPQIITTTFTGRDWEQLYNLVKADGNVPFRTEVLNLLLPVIKTSEVSDGNPVSTATPKAEINPVSNTTSKADGNPVQEATLKALRELGGGVPYRYLYKNIFPMLRASRVEFVYDRIPKYGTLGHNAELQHPLKGWRAHSANDMVHRPTGVLEMRATNDLEHKATNDLEHKVTNDFEDGWEPQQAGDFFMAIKSNLLYDLLIIPNIGVEFPIGKHYSVQGNWMYAWWKSDKHAWYHRTYGGEVEFRRWIGKKHLNRKLTGWHAGIYGQMLTYDFVWGNKGYLGDRWSWGAGVEGGWSKAIGKRLNLDFALNFGYLTGVYQEYISQDGCYVWQATKNRHWIGPTKAEVTLVWLLGK